MSFSFEKNYVADETKRGFREWKGMAMSGIKGQKRGALYIEKTLKEFDRIILIDRLSDSWLTDAFYDEVNYKEIDKKVLILSELADKQIHNIVWRYIGEKEAKEIIELYHLYEYSNRIDILEQGQSFGSLLDYISTGLLTKEEMIAAILR